jgi:hypothetical protein
MRAQHWTVKELSISHKQKLWEHPLSTDTNLNRRKYRCATIYVDATLEAHEYSIRTQDLLGSTSCSFKTSISSEIVAYWQISYGTLRQKAIRYSEWKRQKRFERIKIQLNEILLTVLCPRRSIPSDVIDPYWLCNVLEVDIFNARYPLCLSTFVWYEERQTIDYVCPGYSDPWGEVLCLAREI